MLDLLFKKLPAWQTKRNPAVFSFHSDQESDAGSFAKQNERGILESRASSLVKGFENLKQAWLVQAQPCFIRAYPCPSVVP
jgi:hypothetical protein